MKPRRTYVDGRYGQVHVWIATCPTPVRPPLYCLHQSPKSGLEFEGFAAAASQDRNVIAPDYPGYGLSNAPPAQSAATIEAYASEMWRIVDQLRHTTIDLFGNHTGSQVAAAMALQRPDGVRAIVMVSAAILTPEERSAFINYFSPVPLDREGKRFKEMWDRVTKHAGPGVTLKMMARSFMQNQLGGEGYEWGHAAAFAFGVEFERALSSIAAPIYILNPTDDLQIATRRAARLLKHGRIIETPHWGHGFLDAFPDDAARYVTALLDGEDL